MRCVGNIVREPDVAQVKPELNVAQRAPLGSLQQHLAGRRHVARWGVEPTFLFGLLREHSYWRPEKDHARDDERISGQAGY